MAMVNAVREGQLDKVLVRKYFFHFASNRLVEPVVIVDIKKTSGIAIGPQTLSFGLRKIYVAVTGDEKKWIIKDVVARQIDPHVLGGDVNVRILPNIL